MRDVQVHVAGALLATDAVVFTPHEPVTFKSGLRSPVYVDNRRLPFWPEQWRVVLQGFQQMITNRRIAFDVIAGIETGGIPHSSALGYILQKPSVFVRKRAKEHGLRSRVEGGSVANKGVLLIEDLVTTGTSSLAGVEALRGDGALVEDCLSIMSYGLDEAEEAFEAAGIRFYPLTSFDVILREALQSGRLSREAAEVVEDWIRDPHQWTKRHGGWKVREKRCTMHALDKYNKRVDAVDSLVCVGLDSDFDRLPERFRRDPFPQFAFNKWIIEQTHPCVSAYKPNIAFYEALGDEGAKALKLTMEYLQRHHPDILTICDAKRADIGSTNKAYATALFDWLGFDAVTLQPYLGKEALQPFLERRDKGCIILCRTSNPGAGELQDLEVHGKPLWQIVAERVRDEWNEHGNCMLVVSATYPEELRHVRALVGEMTLLVPGIGAQGGDLEEAGKAGLNSQGRGMIINSSRAIIFSKDPAKAAKQLRDEVNRYR